MSTAKVHRPRGSGYVAPKEWQTVPAPSVGITNGLTEAVPFLFMVGDQSLLSQPGVAIVGSRRATAEGQKRAAQLARELVRHGIVVVSGLAEGIDQAAHRAAIEHGGKTIAVIGTPLDHAYPAKHAALQTQIYREHLLVSPFPIGTRTFPSHFPVRNRVMARLTRATVVIEAGDTSGTLHQCVECEKLGRPLFVAGSVIDDPKLEWPARFKTIIRLTNAQDVIAQVFG